MQLVNPGAPLAMSLSFTFRLAIMLLIAVSAASPDKPAWSSEALAEVGIAVVDIEPAIGIPLAGYGAKIRRVPGVIDWNNNYPRSFYFKPSIGRHSPIRSKAMVIRHNGQQVVFVSVDFVGVELAMVRDLVERLAPLGVTLDNLVISGTHTHHGPGSTTRRFVLAVAAVDKFNRENYDSILDKIEDSVVRAFDNLQSAELVRTSFQTEGIQKNKFRKKGEGHFDNTARFLLARETISKKILGGIVNYPLHGNGMPVGDMRFSSDVLGQIELNMESVIANQNRNSGQSPVVLFMNGAQGDVGNPVKTEEAVMSDGVRFAEQAVAADIFSNLERVEPGISVHREKVWLGMPNRSPKICARDKDSFIAKHGLGLKIPIPFLISQSSYITAVSIGDILMLTVPGEPSTQVGYDLKQAVSDLGYQAPWVLGLANDYMSYFTTKEEYHEGMYDSCSSLFSWKGADRIQAKYLEMLGVSASNKAQTASVSD